MIGGNGPGRLIDLQKILEDSKKIRGAAITGLRTEALSLVAKGFRQAVDPYGVAWAPLKHRRGKPLLHKGRLRSSFTSAEVPEGFRIGTNVTYAKFHQYGTNGRKAASVRFQPISKKGRFAKRAKFENRKRGAVGVRLLQFKAGSGGIPARRMAPQGYLGPTWSAAFQRVAAKAIRASMGKNWKT